MMSIVIYEGAEGAEAGAPKKLRNFDKNG